MHDTVATVPALDQGALVRMHDTLKSVTDPQIHTEDRPASAETAQMPREMLVVDIDELARALKKDVHTVRYHARQKRFGPPVRGGVHIYMGDNLDDHDREDLDRWRAQQAAGTQDLAVKRGVFQYPADLFNSREASIGEQRSAFVLEVERVMRSSGNGYPAAVDMVVAAEHSRAVSTSDHVKPLFPDIADYLSYDTFRKWKELWNKYRTSDLDDSQWHCLCPQYRVAALKRHHGVVDAMQLGEAEIADIRFHILDTDSVPHGLKLYANSRSCRAEVREMIYKILDNDSASIPPSLQRAIYIPPEMKSAFRSKRRFRQNGFTQIRGTFYINSHGQQVELLPGDLWEADDMTVNTPWWCEWPYGGDPCSDKFGIKVGRGQLLAMRDVRSGKWISFSLLMRWKDSYRSVDILQWLGRTFKDVGLPRVGLRFERGSWEGKRIDGIKLMADDGTFDRRFAGMHDLGISLKHSYSAKAKTIEGAFHTLQKLMGSHAVQVGRYRGEFEQATRDLLACQDGRKDPRACGFPHISQLAERIAETLSYLNTHRVRGRIVRGVPDELWARHVNNDASLTVLSRDQEWMFLPDYFEVAVRDGTVQTRRGDALFQFDIADYIKDGLGSGYRITGFFDSALPDMGAWLFNNDGRPCNVRNWPLGHFIGIAPHIPLAPQISLADNVTPADLASARKRWADAYRLEYRALGIFHRVAARTSESNDGLGNINRLEEGIPAPSQRAETVRVRREAKRQQEAQLDEIASRYITESDRAHYLGVDK